ncbi:MAG: DMT family transporter [Flavobacteriales bacterium]|nr:DMT family transporter [Flavobacteriales bacterium]
MISLALAILFSSFIFVIFKLFDRYKIDVFQAIVFNYFTAFLCGILLYGNEWNPAALKDITWFYYAIVAAILFISLFILMGLSSQKNGVAITSVAVKMSMAASVFGMIFLYAESVSLLKILGIIFAFAGVILVSWQSKGASENQKKSLWMLFVLFFGSGILDLVLNYVQNNELKVLTPSLFSAFGFGMAGIIGLIVFFIQLQQKKARFSFKNVLGGIALGIPNYFSIYLLIKSYKDTGWADSTVLAIINVSIVCISALTGFLIFKEKLNLTKALGIIASLLAILMLSLAS